MSYDQYLAQRLELLLAAEPGLQIKKMFGGVGYLLHGNMAVGVHKDYLMVRTGPESYASALAKPHVKVFDLTGKPMTGWVLVEPAGFADEAELKSWVQTGVDYALALPIK
jgi:TfoX/Sxy family transcriptional regulator of competence genes